MAMDDLERSELSWSWVKKKMEKKLITHPSPQSIQVHVEKEILPAARVVAARHSRWDNRANELRQFSEDWLMSVSFA